MGWIEPGFREPPPEEERRNNIIKKLKSPILRELRKRDFIPFNFLRTRLWLYYKTEMGKIRNITPSWFYIKDALDRLESENKIEVRSYEYDNDQSANWIILKSVIDTDQEIVDRLKGKLERQKKIKKKIGRVGTKIGAHNENLIKEAFVENGFAASRGDEYSYESDGEVIQIDVTAHKSGKTIFIESKNKYSECYHHPEIGGKDESDYKQLIEFFEFSKKYGATPVLWASLVDKSFHSFVKEYDGYFFRQLFQYYRPKDKKLVRKIKDEFNLGHVKYIKKPKEPMINWIDTHLL